MIDTYGSGVQWLRMSDSIPIVVVIGVVLGKNSFAYRAVIWVVLVTIPTDETMIGWFDCTNVYEKLLDICRAKSIKKQ